MGTFVTLAEVLEARGSPLDEGELWGLLLATAESLLEISSKGPGNMCSMLSPGSVLLSASGNLAFKSCSRSEDVVSFTAPEIRQGHVTSTRTAAEKMVVYSLGMTLYWCADYQLPQTQPVQLSSELDGLLLSMCEDVVMKRVDLLVVLETCEQHHTASLLPPPDRLVRQLVEDVFRDSVDHVTMTENGTQLTDHSQMVRDRFHGGSFGNSSWAIRRKASRSFSGALYRTENTGISAGGRYRDSYTSWQQLNRSPCSPYMDGGRNANSRALNHYSSTISLNDKKLKDMGPEFIRMQDEPLIVLELPGSIGSKKGRSSSTQREVGVVMPSGQSIQVRCEVKSQCGDVFDMIVAHSNLVEHFYFGLAYIDDNEFFFLDNDTKISKVAPDCWNKVPTTTFILFFRVKFFISDISLLLHKLSRHQFYLQLRKDFLEDRLSCHEETSLCLAGLALQAEYGDCMPEVYGRNYYRLDHYISKSVMEKRALPYIQDELLRLHVSNAQMLSDESEMEFLKVSQHLPEYGVLFYRVVHEKRPVEGQIILGVCAKGVIVYEVKDGRRATSQTFFWRDTSTISSNKRKFIIECRGNKKKYTFVTERSKIAKYLCNLCSAQHKFNNEMSSRQLSHSLVSEDNNIGQRNAACQAPGNLLKSFPSPPTPQDDSRLTTPLEDSGPATPQDDSMTKLCDDIAARIEARIKQQRQSLNHQSTSSSSQQSSTGMRSLACSQKSSSLAHSHIPVTRDSPAKLASEREVICVSLKKDRKLGLGIVIVGEDTVGRYDLGIFVASIVPGGPADKDGRIRQGGRLISLNQTSLEGVTFTEAAEVMQSSPPEVQLIISQPKVPLSPNNLGNHHAPPSLQQHPPPLDLDSSGGSLDEIISVMMTPKTCSKLQVPPDIRIYNAQDGSLSSLNSVRPEELTLELRKKGGALGISISGGINSNLRNGGLYIKSLVPGGAAERDGRIHTDDRLLEVDGVRMDDFTYQQAVECLTKTGEVVSLVLERERMNLPRVSLSPDTASSLSPKSCSSDTNHLRYNSCPAINTTQDTSSGNPQKPRAYRFMTDDNTFEVSLTKGSKGLGFSFIMCDVDPRARELGSVVRIKQLFPNQPAHLNGRIREGDVIVAIDGQPLKDLIYPRVLQLFKNSSSEVRLSLCRPAPGILPPIEQFAGT
ncbi:unnamed protein product [Lota lota]